METRWKRGEIEIVIMPGGTREVVPALLREGLAINRERPGGVWSITHVASGLAMAAFLLRREARAAAGMILAAGPILDDLAAFEMTAPWKKVAAMAARRQVFAEWEDLNQQEQEAVLLDYRRSRGGNSNARLLDEVVADLRACENQAKAGWQYYLAMTRYIAADDAPAWRKISDAIRERWPKGLARVKKIAHKHLREQGGADELDARAVGAVIEDAFPAVPSAGLRSLKELGW